MLMSLLDLFKHTILPEVVELFLLSIDNLLQELFYATYICSRFCSAYIEETTEFK